ITAHLGRVAGVMEADGTLARDETKVLTRYIARLTFAFRALSLKYLLVGRDTGRFFGSLAIDAAGSGFPAFDEMMTLAADAAQADRHLDDLPPEAALKRQMVEMIVGARRVPTKLQFALSQRLYYEELARGDIFWPRNDPQIQWIGDAGGRRRYRIHWAAFDTQVGLPVIYLMEVEESGRTALPKDAPRWAEAQAHLMAQGLGGLKLMTIAQGFDEDFDDVHPKRLRRFHIGPFYSSAFTAQPGPLSDVLAGAKAPEGQDWALVWTEEDLISDRVRTERSGWFGRVDREVFALDPFAGRGAETGATRTQRSIILPQRPYQVLADQGPPGFAGVTKYVVSGSGRVLRYEGART
ncbi:MAG: hypothetical protein AAGF60_06895, partial [Pseudomonadota bacterium]